VYKRATKMTISVRGAWEKDKNAPINRQQLVETKKKKGGWGSD